MKIIYIEPIKQKRIECEAGQEPLGYLIETDDRVKLFNTPIPDGYKLEYINDTYAHVLILIPTQLELDLITLNNAKVIKISDINIQTGEAIVAKSGDIYKQLEKTIEHQILVRKKTDGEATLEDNQRIADLEALSGEVLDLKYTGNNREEIVALVEMGEVVVNDVVTIITLDEALAEVEAI